MQLLMILRGYSLNDVLMSQHAAWYVLKHAYLCT
jgi:hypothetical protein